MENYLQRRKYKIEKFHLKIILVSLQLANCTAMLNQFSILLDLSEKILDSKVQNDYIFHPQCRLATMREETGLKMDKAELESYRSQLGKSDRGNLN